MAARGRDAAPSTKGGSPAQERELRAQGRKTMRKLLDAGKVVFGKRGYHAARVDDIVKMAKTSHGTFYLYFSNKEDLFRALLHDVAADVDAVAQTLGPVDPGPEGRVQLREWLGRLAGVYAEYGPVIRAWTEAEIDESELGRLGAEVLTGLGQRLTERIQEASTLPVDPALAGMAVLAMIERVHYYQLIRRVQGEPDAMLDTLAAVTHAALFAKR